MRKNLVIAALIGVLSATLAFALGPERLVAIVRGGFGDGGTTRVSVPSNGDVALISGNGRRMDATCFNNSAFTIWIGTNSATTTLIEHGFPILSSTTFVMDAWSDAVYGIATGGTAEVRCWEGVIP